MQEGRTRPEYFGPTRSRMGMEPCQNVKMRVLYIGDVRGMLLSAHSDLTEMPFPRCKETYETGSALAPN